ncbi:ATP-dependent RecD-like DNA helicase [Faecalibacillus faecis]|uniref:SF1B family DNA helicase RecD2 n=1 Tax=Faecalibacillus faecis TaxID=1982628 RepID=UPI003868A9D2
MKNIISELDVQVTKIIHQNNGYVIAGAVPLNEKEYSEYLNKYHNISIKGNGMLHEGLSYILNGYFEDGPYGYTYVFQNYHRKTTENKDGIIAYLQTLKGVGKKTAERIYKTFGNESINVISKDPMRLVEVKGLSKRKVKKIAEDFKEDYNFEEVSIFLGSLGCSSTLATKICQYPYFNTDAKRKIEENPYSICKIQNISFKQADSIAFSLGFTKDNFKRLFAAISCVLQNAYNQAGHLFLYEQQMYNAFSKLTDVYDFELYQRALEESIAHNYVSKIEDKIYLTSIMEMEDDVSSIIAGLCNEVNYIEGLDNIIADIEKRENIVYDANQKNAIKILNSGSVGIITGGPGTGKTTIIKAILNVFKATGQINKVALAAPTGRAAKRMEEATGVKAKTVHRLLEVDPASRSFVHNKDNHLSQKIIIIDESSMFDISLFKSLVEALDEDARLILVGDIDQLPPVGAGYIFRDLINSQVVPVIKLTKIYRQSDGSTIIENARNINNGILQIKAQKDSFEYSLWNMDNNYFNNIYQMIILSFQRFREQFKNDEDFLYGTQILTPMKKGYLGVFALNNLIQSYYNPEDESKPEMTFNTKDYPTIFRINDKVIQIVNNYDKRSGKDEDADNEIEGVFNGDLGIVSNIIEDELEVTFENGFQVWYKKDEIRDNLMLAYAITVHKSQGSEFKDIIAISSSTHTIMNQRNVLYTAITRARDTAILIGDKEAVKNSILTCTAVIRNTRTVELIQKYAKDNNIQRKIC